MAEPGGSVMMTIMKKKIITDSSVMFRGRMLHVAESSEIKRDTLPHMKWP